MQSEVFQRCLFCEEIRKNFRISILFNLKSILIRCILFYLEMFFIRMHSSSGLHNYESVFDSAKLYYFGCYGPSSLLLSHWPTRGQMTLGLTGLLHQLTRRATKSAAVVVLTGMVWVHFTSLRLARVCGLDSTWLKCFLLSHTNASAYNGPLPRLHSLPAATTRSRRTLCWMHIR